MQVIKLGTAIGLCTTGAFIGMPSIAATQEQSFEQTEIYSARENDMTVLAMGIVRTKVPIRTEAENASLAAIFEKRDPDAQRILRIVTDQLGLPSAESVQPRARFIEDLGADSLDIFELTAAIEEEFDMKIPKDVCITMPIDALELVRDDQLRKAKNK